VSCVLMMGSFATGFNFVLKGTDEAHRITANTLVLNKPARDYDPNGEAILVVGNLSDGYHAVGPFTDHHTAAESAEGSAWDTWVATLERP